MPLVPFGGPSRRRQSVQKDDTDRVPTKVAGKARKNKTIDGGKVTIGRVITDTTPGMPNRVG